MTDYTIHLPDDPAAARDYLLGRLTSIAQEQVQLTAMLDRLKVPTHQHGQRLTFHQRIAVLTGLYQA